MRAQVGVNHQANGVRVVRDPYPQPRGQGNRGSLMRVSIPGVTTDGRDAWKVLVFASPASTSLARACRGNNSLDGSDKTAERWWLGETS